MAKPSIYAQLAAVQVAPGPFMMPSPRHWNPGLLKYKGRIWMCYRYHLGREHASRCATALVPLDKATLQPTALSQHLNLPQKAGDEHFEDARLFLYEGKPHISYTKLVNYQPGVDYSCVMEYARLKLLGNRWLIEEVFWPRYGRNHGSAKEKNWIFFDHGGKLYCIYDDVGVHRVLRIEGDRVVEELESPAATWPWGDIRGGAPPVPYRPTMGADGKVNHLLVIFHSSLRTEQEPHYVRYYAGAYMMENKPPFRITAVASKPLAAGSEADGHGFDPRYSAGWKPFVVFPCGAVYDGDDLLVSLGVNDWQCAVGRMSPERLQFIAPDGSDAPERYFRTENGSLPVQMIGRDGSLTWIPWKVPVTNRRGAMAAPGFYATRDGREAESVESAPRVTEITEAEYRTALRQGETVFAR
jgi:predicted GH43/DUF377 family glycosyl hydrolase